MKTQLRCLVTGQTFGLAGDNFVVLNHYINGNVLTLRAESIDVQTYAEALKTLDRYRAKMENEAHENGAPLPKVGFLTVRQYDKSDAKTWLPSDPEATAFWLADPCDDGEQMAAFHDRCDGVNVAKCCGVRPSAIFNGEIEPSTIDGFDPNKNFPMSKNPLCIVNAHGDSIPFFAACQRMEEEDAEILVKLAESGTFDRDGQALFNAYCSLYRAKYGNEFYVNTRLDPAWLVRDSSGRAPITFREAIKASGKTQKQIAREAGVNASLVEKLRSGASKIENVTSRNAVALADVLGVSLPDLLVGEAKKNLTKN